MNTDPDEPADAEDDPTSWPDLQVRLEFLRSLNAGQLDHLVSSNLFMPMINKTLEEADDKALQAKVFCALMSVGCDRLIKVSQNLNRIMELTGQDFEVD